MRGVKNTSVEREILFLKWFGQSISKCLSCHKGYSNKQSNRVTVVFTGRGVVVQVPRSSRNPWVKLNAALGIVEKQR